MYVNACPSCILHWSISPGTLKSLALAGIKPFRNTPTTKSFLRFGKETKKENKIQMFQNIFCATSCPLMPCLDGKNQFNFALKKFFSLFLWGVCIEKGSGECSSRVPEERCACTCLWALQMFPLCKQELPKRWWRIHHRNSKLKRHLPRCCEENLTYACVPVRCVGKQAQESRGRQGVNSWELRAAVCVQVWVQSQSRALKTFL